MTTTATPEWTLSVVSHGHGTAVRQLLLALARCLDPGRYEILLTLNLPEAEAPLVEAWPGALRLIRNTRPQGFGTNHNSAFRQARGHLLAAIDPDLRLAEDPFPPLSEALADPAVGIVSTRVLDEHGAVADHARSLPTLARLLRRHAAGEPSSYDRALDRELEVHWVAGLFMALRRETFERLGGFDPRYHMYCEDVDLCLRAWNAGLAVRVVPAAWVTHPARRQTFRRTRHFLWHARSLARLWTSPTFRTFQHRTRHER